MTTTSRTRLPSLPLVFTVAEARAKGASRSRLRRLDLAVPLHGARVQSVGTPPTWTGLGFAAPPHSWTVEDLTALQRLRPDAVLSHATAAHLHGIPRPLDRAVDAPEPVSVSTPRDVRRPGVRVHRRTVPPEHRSVVHGLTVTSPERTWADLCAVRPRWDEADLVAAGDHLVRHPWAGGGRLPPRTTVERLAEVLEALAPFHGVGRARAALGRVRVGADSAMETHARLALIDARLGEPLLQHKVAPDDPALAESDLYFADLRVALEYDGEHHLDRQQQARDARRDRRLLSYGVTPMRITAADHAEGYRSVIAQLQQRRRAHDSPSEETARGES